MEFDIVLDYNADIETYKRSRKRLRQIDTTGYSTDRIAHINAMIRDCDYVIEWLEKGCRPGLRRGIERRAGYQRDVPMDLDVMRRYMGRGNRGNVAAHENISQEQMIMMEEALDILTVQQRDAFVMVAVNRFSLDMAAEIMGLKKTSVQNHVDRAKAKVAAFITKYHHQISLSFTG